MSLSGVHIVCFVGFCLIFVEDVHSCPLTFSLQKKKKTKVCKFRVHKRCVAKATPNCKWRYLNNVPEDCRIGVKKKKIHVMKPSHLFLYFIFIFIIFINVLYTCKTERRNCPSVDSRQSTLQLQMCCLPQGLW